MSLPPTMRAVIIRAHGDIDRLEFGEVPLPVIGHNAVLIKLAATGLNHLDLWVRRGVTTHKFPLPLIPGCDGAGTIAAVGSAVTSWNVGDRVAIAPVQSCGACEQCLSGEQQLCRYFGVLGETTNGTCAEYVAVPEVNLLRIPSHLSFEEASSLPLVFLTAHHMLVHRARLQPGETVLIHAAGSGVGSAAIQLASMIRARIIALASTADKLLHAHALGATTVINYTDTDWVTEVRLVTGKAGVDVVFENVGATTWSGSLKSLKKGGRLVTCGATSGPIVESDLRLIFFKSLSILGSTMGGLGEMRQVWRLVEQGLIHPTIDRTFSITEIREAHQYLQDRRQFGKVILTHDWN